MIKNKITHLIVVALAIGAMILPWGAVLRYMDIENGLKTASLKTFSFFDPTVFSNGNYTPLICAVLTVVLFLLLLFSFFGNESKGINIALTALSIVATILSLLPPVLYGFEFFSTTAMAIFYLLLCSSVMSVQRLTGKYFATEDEETEE